MVRVLDRATLHLNLGSEGGQREVQHGDELVILAAITLLKLCNLYVQEPAKSGDTFVQVRRGILRPYLLGLDFVFSPSTVDAALIQRSYT